ncbi:MAG: signal peptidase I [Cyanobacteriota bacterium]|nr:signal peptidase I [Cyanobacteriota bacterium]
MGESPAHDRFTSADGSAGSWFRRQVLPVLAWVLVALVLRWAVLEPRWIPSGSMLPTLQLQDRVLVEKLRMRLAEPLPLGAIVVFHPPPALMAAGYDRSAALIKRVVARGGDRVAVREGRLWRNGAPLSPDWSPVRIDYELEEFRVPEGQLMVLGDNRNASLDSHLWGPLNADAVIGTAVWRYWPPSRFGPIGGSPPSAGG